MNWTRREFLRNSAATVAGWTIGLSAEEMAAALDLPMPMRTLGRTGVKVSALGFGSAPLGQSFQPQEVFDRVVGEALDLGVNYLDTATIYDVAQERLGPIVKRHRDRIFLVTKTRGMSRGAALKTIEESLRLLQTDRLDLVHMHNVPDFDTDRLLDDNSALRGIQEAQKRGWVRFIGATAHYRISRVLPALETGLIDVTMLAMNYVDQHTYGFETKALPAARKHKMGIVAMKVLGGAPGFRYSTPTPCYIPKERIRNAIRYALGIPGLTTAVIGFNFVEQVREAAAVVKSCKPLSQEELAALTAEGKQLAAEWGAHLGPVA
jgi:aryl-alcohol dehydrogenase-like predicted oxidoreductase